MVGVSVWVWVRIYKGVKREILKRSVRTGWQRQGLPNSCPMFLCGSPYFAVLFDLSLSLSLSLSVELIIDYFFLLGCE